MSEELRRLAESARRGPWTATRLRDGGDFIVISEAEKPGENGICSMWVHGVFSGNIQVDEQTWKFIAAANPKTILALLDERDRLRAALDRIRDITKDAAEKEYALAEAPFAIADEALSQTAADAARKAE